MIKDTLSACIKTALQGGKPYESINGKYYIDNTEIFVAIILLIIYVVIILFIGKFLWNVVLVKLVSIARPADSIWEILGLALLLCLLYVN